MVVMDRLMLGKNGNDRWGSTDLKISGLKLATELGTLCKDTPQRLGNLETT